MVYLIATILLNTVLFTLFKLFPKFKVDSLQAIVVNYIVCVITGCISLKKCPFGASSLHQDWLLWAVLMGTMFIGLFNLIAWRTQKDGMTTTTVANKLSLVIPVIFSVLLYGEQLSTIKTIGIIIAFPAVYLATKPPTEDIRPKNFLFPVILFVGSGLLDTLVKYVQVNFLKTSKDQAVYTIHLFAAAAIAGLIIIAIQRLSNKIQFQWRNIIAGALLGIPNYFSILLLIKLLHSDFLQSSAAIPVNNIGIVLLSSLTAILVFKEKANRQRLIGLALSIASILLIALSDIHGRTI